MKQDCQPHFIHADGAPIGLCRVDFAHLGVQEKFLQEQLHRNPSILPIEQLDDSFAPLVSLGREILSIDNLFIAPSGRITVVETKLWRNPQATREVLAQILDYAKRLSTLSYEEFETACRSARPSVLDRDGSLYRLVASKIPAFVESEADFIDAVQRNLRQARFLLLVVGDGIRESLESTLSLLHQQPHMLFTLALVEMHIYECEGMPGRLIVPHVVAHSKEIVRAVVRVENHTEAMVSVALPPESAEKSTTLSEAEFLESIEDSMTRILFTRLIAFAKEFGYIKCAGNSVNARMEFQGTGDLRFYRLFRNGRIVAGRLGEQLLERGLTDEVAWDLARDLVAAFPSAGLKAGKPELVHTLQAGEVAKRLDEFVAAYRKAIERLRTMTPTEIPARDNEEPESDNELETEPGAERFTDTPRFTPAHEPTRPG